MLSNTSDKDGGAVRHSSVRTQSLLSSMISDWGLSDIFRFTHGDQKIFSHVDKRHKTHTSLEFFVINDRIVYFPICRSDISHDFKSDHS